MELAKIRNTAYGVIFPLGNLKGIGYIPLIFRISREAQPSDIEETLYRILQKFDIPDIADSKAYTATDAILAYKACVNSAQTHRPFIADRILGDKKLSRKNYNKYEKKEHQKPK